MIFSRHILIGKIDQAAIKIHHPYGEILYAIFLGGGVISVWSLLSRLVISWDWHLLPLSSGSGAILICVFTSMWLDTD